MNETDMNVVPDETNPEQVKKNLSYENKVIKKIAGISTDDIPGVVTLSGGLIGNIADRFRNADDKTRGIGAEVGEKEVALDLNVVCEYGRNIPELFDQIIEKVGSAIQTMTGLAVVEVNMHVEDVVRPEEFAELKKTQQKNQPKPQAEGEADAEPSRVN